MGFNFNIFSSGGGGSGSSAGTIAKYPTASVLPAVAADGDVAIVLDTNILYSFDTGVGGWVVIGGPGVAITVSDTASVDLTLTGNVLSAVLNITGLTNPPQSYGISLIGGASGLYGVLRAYNISEQTSSVLQFSGSSFPVLGGSLGIRINQASGATSGYVSAADYTNFAAGVSALLNTVFPIFGAGRVYTGLTLSIPAANGTTGGYLTAADWVTFNAKGVSLTAGPGIQITGSTILATTAVGLSGGQNIYGGVGSSENLIINSTLNATPGNVLISPSTGSTGCGYVGIGTTSPLIKLDVLGGFRSVGFDIQRTYFYENGGVTNLSTAIDGHASTASTFYGIINAYRQGNDYVAPIHVGVCANSATDNYYGMFMIRTRGTIWGANTALVNGDALPALAFCGQTVDGNTAARALGAVIQGKVDGVVSADVLPTSLVFKTSPTNLVGIAERMRITSAGNVGIGTTSPVAKLDIEGSVAFHTDNTYDIGAAAANRPRTSYAATSHRSPYFVFSGASLISIGSSSSAGYTLILPPAQGATNTVLSNDGLGNLSWAVGAAGGWLDVSAANGTATSATRFVGVTTTTADRLVSIDLVSGSTGAVIVVQKLDSGLGQVLVGSTQGINGASIMIITGQWSKMSFTATGSGFYA